MSRGIRQFGGVLLLYLVSAVWTLNDTSTFFTNQTLPEDFPKSLMNVSGGKLWDNLIRDCKNPTYACLQNNMYKYLKDVFENTKDYEMGFVKLMQNNISYSEEQDNATEDTVEDYRGNPLGEVTSSLTGKAMKFVMTHDMQLQMPDMIFEGSSLKISPRSSRDTGVMLKLDLIPRANKAGTPRIFFKKIKQIIGEKLMNALMGLMLILSLLSVKFMFMAPMMIGVAAAKKMLLKVLLFFFPFLAHLFKLCPYYDPHMGTKFHHHHHQISHLHHVPPPPFIKHPPPVIELDHPPYHDHDHHNHHDHGHDDHYDVGLEYYSQGPGLTHDFISHRKTDKHQGSKDDNDVYAWMGGQGQDAKRTKRPNIIRPLTPGEVEKLALRAEREAVMKVRLQREHQRVIAENRLLQEQIKQSLQLQEKLRTQASMMQHNKHVEGQHFAPGGILTPPVSSGVKPSQFLQSPPAPPVNQASVKATIAVRPNSYQPPQQTPQQPPPSSPSRPTTHPTTQTPKQSFSQAIQKAAAITFDPFYSPILEKIDGILNGIGFVDEPCKERIVCSMYKNPTKFSPHSNLLSAQLSRDASELQKPSKTNAAVIRFYRYVQAARDGQDKRECLRLYPSCSINTEL